MYYAKEDEGEIEIIGLTIVNCSLFLSLSLEKKNKNLAILKRLTTSRFDANNKRTINFSWLRSLN